MLTALAAIGTHLVNGEKSPFLPETPTPAPTDPPQPTTTKRRGRPPGSTAAPAVEAPTETPTPEPEKPVEESATTGKTYEELQAIIKPLVQAGRGTEVKKEIQKYGVAGLQQLAELPMHHDEFVKNIEALSL